MSQYPYNFRWPMVIGVNGPPESGKGWLINQIKRHLIPDAVIISVQDVFYRMMQMYGVAPADMSYAEYKKTEDARAHIIGFVESHRGRDINVFTRELTNSTEYQKAEVVIYDNIGFQHEVDWFQTRSHEFLLLRLDTSVSDGEPLKSLSRREPGQSWLRDSRGPIDVVSAGPNHCLTAYDSQQMWLLLNWLSSGAMTREQAGLYSDVKPLWDRFVGERKSAPIFPFERINYAPGELGGLGSAASGLSTAKRLRLDTAFGRDIRGTSES